MTCGISFGDEFIDQDDDLKSTLVVAMHSALTEFMEVGMMVDTREEFMERATEDAANFLDRCVKKQGGRLH
jgi:ribosomal protein L16/L10AE